MPTIVGKICQNCHLGYIKREKDVKDISEEKIGFED